MFPPTADKDAWVEYTPMQCVPGPDIEAAGVFPLDVVEVSWQGVSVCLACGVCPDGTTLYVFVDDSDLNTMLGLGFTASDGP